MTIAVAYKVAANPQDARVEPDGRIDWSRGKLGISDYDPAAIQVAREAADVSGTELVGVSVGTVAATAAKEKKNVLARGLDRVMTLGTTRRVNGRASRLRRARGSHPTNRGCHFSRYWRCVC